jgi:RNA polymerase sigma-70 factor (ECF subfamily)
MPAIEETTDSSSGLSLAVRLRDGSDGAWRELVDLYGPLVEDWCRQAGLADAARADVGQDVFLAVHRGIGRFDPSHPRATFRGWLWTITRNAVREWKRRGQRQPAAAGGSTAQGQMAELPDPWGEISRDEPPSTPDATASLLRRALDQIRPAVEPQTWSAFWQTAVLGKSAPEAADELGIAPAAVRQAKSRVLRRLRRQLGDR